MLGRRATIEQYSATTAERGPVPIWSAIAMISSLLKPSRGRRIGMGVAWLMVARFLSVWEETCPSASPVAMAQPPHSRAIASAERSIERLRSTCQ